MEIANVSAMLDAVIEDAKQARSALRLLIEAVHEFELVLPMNKVDDQVMANLERLRAATVIGMAELDREPGYSTKEKSKVL